MNFLPMAIADLLAIAALCTIYLMRHRNREMALAYTIINVGVFAVTVAMASASTTSAALGLGLFGVLSIIRLRSTALSQREVAYYFVALAMGLIAGINIDPAYIAYSLMGLLLVIMALADGSIKGAAEKNQIITVDRAISREEEIIAYLNARLGYSISSVKINEIDLINDKTIAEIQYSVPAYAPVETTQNAPAAMSISVPAAY